MRDIIFEYAKRGALRPQLEEAGLLDEPGIFLQMRRPADVLVEGLGVGSREASSESVWLALDIKVINAVGADHFDATLLGSLNAATP